MDKKVHLNKDITAVNRMCARSPMSAYQDTAEALAGGSSPNKVSLNGTYAFLLCERPELAEDFFRPDFDAAGAKPIQVPGNWETQGFDEPIYTNLVFPWDYNSGEPCTIKPGTEHPSVPNPPFIPGHNPTGCYRKWFTLPAHFEGRDISLYFEGVETAYHLWVNGTYVGYSEDSKLPSQFDITPYVVPGENLMALQVMRFSTATYMEDQDYWYLSGIYRDVWLLGKPKIAIDDYKVQALPDLHHFTGTVTADVTVTRRPGFADCTVGMALYDGDALVCQDRSPVMPAARYRTAEQPTANTARVALHTGKISLWSPESPKLYTLIITLYGPDGRVLDVESCKTGFKKIEVVNGVILLNGSRLVIKGVNRHEHCPTGRTVSREHMAEEIRQMKRMHINSVRTCHYPDSPLWYDLCDQYGILLVCECNLETHGIEGQLSHDAEYAGAYLERATRMVRTHKNHVSIYSWSLGNESGCGANHAAMYGFIKEYDKDRLCQYEAGEPGKNISDIRGNMYAPIHKIMELLTDVTDDRPIILVEYLYQISNTGGGARLFRALTERYPRFQGGYVWDWQDKCLYAAAPNGTSYFAYGGDFNESYVEASVPPYMTNNGIVLPDLRWKPVAFELKQAYAPVRVERPRILSPWQSQDTGNCYIVRNGTDTLMLDAFACTAYLKENGIVIASREVPLPSLTPGMACSLQVAIPHEKKPGCEYCLDFIITRKTPEWFEKAGDTVSATQHMLQSESYRPAVPATSGSLTLTERDRYVISGNCFSYSICKSSGRLLSAEKNGAAYLANSMKPCFTRGRTGIDCEPSWGSYAEYGIFTDAEVSVTPDFAAASNETLVIAFTVSAQKNGCALMQGGLTYTAFGDGRLKVEYTPNLFPLLVPRAGLELTVPAGFEQLCYYGYGENENYCDRMESARLGVYTGTVEAEHFPFIPPSENGGHEGTRWVSLADDAGRTLTFTGEIPFHFDAHHSTVEDYRSAKHDHQLPRRPETILHLDAAHSQIGGEMAWSTQLDERLHIGNKAHRLCFTITME